MLARPLYEGIILENLYNVQIYMEIGSFDGEGIAMLSKKFPDKMFYSIDPFIEDGHTSRGTGVAPGKPLPGIREHFYKSIKDCGNVFHFDMTDEAFIRGRLYNLIYPDILFIDGDHSFESATLDLQLAELFAKSKRLLVIMDDTVNIEGVAKALSEFKTSHLEIVFNILPDYGAVYFYMS
jgi:hypothetical protein